MVYSPHMLQNTSCCIVICWCMQKYTYIYLIHTDAMITDAVINDARRKTQEDFFTNIFTSVFIARVRKGCWRFACERVLETEHKLYILTPLLWPSRCVFLVLLDAQPEVLGSTAGCWLSLLHLISIFSGPQLIRASSPIGLVWLSLPHLVSNSLEVCWQLLWHLTQLNYIIIQRPHDHPLDLWNRMFNRHQAEITVMQFTGHSLPVHLCSSTVGPSPCPIL